MLLKIDRESRIVFSDWFINLSAGWFGSLFILPLFSFASPLLLLTVNLPAAIISLLLAIWLKKQGVRL